MIPGTIAKNNQNGLLFLLVKPLIPDEKNRIPITILSVDPFEIDGVFTQVHTDRHVYYLVPGAGWLTKETVGKLEPVDTLQDDQVLFAVSADPLILTQLRNLQNE